jgi:hypothetical protein
MSISLQEENHHLKESLLIKDTYIQKLNNQKNTLQGDLEASKSSRKTFEEESLRIRTEMRSQMDRLRGNMNTLRKQGGEQSQVLEKEMDLLGKKCEELQYSLELAEQTKDNLNVEITHIRTELERGHGDFTRQSKAIEKLKVQGCELQSQLKKSLLDLIHMTSLFNASDSSNIELRTQFQDEKNELELSINDLNNDMKNLATQHASIDNTFQTDRAALRLEIQHSSELLESHQTNSNRIENTMQIEINRLEDILATQNKSYEDLSNEFNDVKKLNTFEFSEINKENILLREHLVQLQETVDSVNIFVENITNDSLAIDSIGQEIELNISSNDNSNHSILLDDDMHEFDPQSSPYQSAYSSRNTSPVSMLKSTLSIRSSMKSPTNFTSVFNDPNGVILEEQNDDQPSQYNSLCYAMELLLSFFSHTIRDESNMTNFSINEYRKNSLKITENNVIIETFKQNEQLFHDSMYRLQDVVNRSQSEYHTLKIRNSVNNDEITRLKNDHHDLEVTCQKLLGIYLSIYLAS